MQMYRATQVYLSTVLVSIQKYTLVARYSTQDTYTNTQETYSNLCTKF